MRVTPQLTTRTPSSQRKAESTLRIGSALWLIRSSTVLRSASASVSHHDGRRKTFSSLLMPKRIRAGGRSLSLSDKRESTSKLHAASLLSRHAKLAVPPASVTTKEKSDHVQNTFGVGNVLNQRSIERMVRLGQPAAHHFRNTV